MVRGERVAWEGAARHGMERRRYKHPPIEEALVECRFEPSPDWDLTMPGRLHVELREKYPGKPRQQNVVHASLGAQQGQAQRFAIREGVSKVQLLTDEATRLVAIGPDELSVHMLRPYQCDEGPSGWDEFRPRIVGALTGYWKDDVRLVVSYATVEAPEDHVAFLMDIDLIWQSAKGVDNDAALKTADDLRTKERKVFEALITDDARSLFDAT